MSHTLNPYHIALAQIPRLGGKSIRQLLELVPDVESLFSMSHAQLVEIFSTHKDIIEIIESGEALRKAEESIPTLERHGIDALFFTDDEYPQRLNEVGCEDTPVLLYRLGSCDLNASHTIAMVGARKCTDYGRQVSRRLVSEMSSDKPLVISGLAYGIDTASHTACVEYGVPTVAVLGHGLDTIYPQQNRPLAKKILDQGGALLTEYPLGTQINPLFFPARNRIVAGMSDATVIVESAAKGGALITANIASGYNREVFAIPGRLDDPMSFGCNSLIVNNRALAIRDAADIYFQMGWSGIKSTNQQAENQLNLFASLSADQQMIVDLLKEHREMTLDDFSKKCDLSTPKIAALLMDLEVKKVVYCIPGRLYKLF